MPGKRAAAGRTTLNQQQCIECIFDEYNLLNIITQRKWVYIYIYYIYIDTLRNIYQEGVIYCTNFWNTSLANQEILGLRLSIPIASCT